MVEPQLYWGVRRTMLRLPPTLRSYLAFCDVREKCKNSTTLELDADFVFPTTLLPLAVLRARSKRVLHASKPAVQGYVNWIMTADQPSEGGTYVPLVRLPDDPEAHLAVIRRLQDLSTNTDLFSGNRDAYHYLLSELVDNIYQHAEADHAYVMAQYYPNKGLMEASFMDDGMTIPKSLKQGTGATYPPGRGYQAILDALQGKSAKPGGERGFGLRTSVRVVNALDGEVIIVSDGGAVVAEKSGRRRPYALGPRHILDGTLVSLRLPNSSKRVNLYDLIEG